MNERSHSKFSRSFFCDDETIYAVQLEDRWDNSIFTRNAIHSRLV